MKGSITDHPRGSGGFGWNAIFIPEGLRQTYAELDEEHGLLAAKQQEVYDDMKTFLTSHE